MSMLVEVDDVTGATYCVLVDRPLARSISVTDLVNVDVDEAGVPIGVEFAVHPVHIPPGELDVLVERYPDLKGLVASFV